MREKMLRNADYNLMEEIVQLSKALYRFDTFVRDAESDGCSGCVELWNRMKERNSEDMQMFLGHFREHMERGMMQSGEERPKAA
jgi:hypothetical protein